MNSNDWTDRPRPPWSWDQAMTPGRASVVPSMSSLTSIPPAPPGASASAEYLTMTQLAAVPPTVKSIEVCGTSRNSVDFVLFDVSAVLKSMVSIFVQLPVARAWSDCSAAAKTDKSARNNTELPTSSALAIMVGPPQQHAILIEK